MAKQTTTRTFRPSETPFVLALLLLATRIATSHAFFVDSWSNIRSSNTRNSNIGKPCNDQRLPQRLAWYQRNFCSLPVAPLYSADSDDDSHQQYDNGDAYDSQTLLSLRIQQLKDKEAQEARAVSQALTARVQELQQSKRMDDLLLDDTATSPQVVHLPVVCMDALLPQQPLEGRTEDPTFCVFLRDLGLGGRFVMTSLDPTTRKIRRHGVVVKIVAVDALKNGETAEEKEKDSLKQIPTAVDFQIMGQAQCRIIGADRQGMQARIGRWRRGYDPNGEEVVLGWGDERFVDAPKELVMDARYELDLDDQVENEKTGIESTDKLPSTEWNDLPVLVRLKALEDSKTNQDTLSKAQELSEMVDEWYGLASRADTYNNVNVTAATRIRRGEPGLWVEPDKLLARVSKQLGPRPPLEDPTAFCLWAAALINPLPPLGVSLEIRGRLLEAPTVQRRLEILELGLRRSIDNLRGRRPLV